jgi:glycerol-3-phosphate dehydrogenase
VQGSHLVYEGPPQQGVYYVESPRDGRAIFVMPWRGKLLVGTTEVRFHGDPATVAPGAQEIHYLQAVLRQYFPRFRAAELSQPVTSFAGLRVLPAGVGHAFHRSRETLLTTDRPARPRLLSIFGGKLTTWRAVSARALAMIGPSLPSRPALARTDQLVLRAS